MRKLGKYKKLLDEFFDTRESYNNKQLQDFLDEKRHPHKHTEDGVRYYLEWYADYILGKRYMIVYLNKDHAVLRANYDYVRMS